MTVALPVRSPHRRLRGLCCSSLAALGACRATRVRCRHPAPWRRTSTCSTAGRKALEKKHWVDAREYFRRLVDTYPRSSYRAGRQARHRRYLPRRGRASSRYILAANEFREFLQFFPLNPRADYAQYRLALAQMKQMLGPQRDQTATHEALAEFDAFRQSYPNSKYKPEVEKLYRETRDRLSDRVPGRSVLLPVAPGMPARSSRLQGLLNDDPGYSHRDERLFPPRRDVLQGAATRSGDCPTTSGWSRNTRRASGCPRRRSGSRRSSRNQALIRSRAFRESGEGTATGPAAAAGSSDPGFAARMTLIRRE